MQLFELAEQSTEAAQLSDDERKMYSITSVEQNAIVNFQIQKAQKKPKFLKYVYIVSKQGMKNFLTQINPESAYQPVIENVNSLVEKNEEVKSDEGD